MLLTSSYEEKTGKSVSMTLGLSWDNKEITINVKSYDRNGKRFDHSYPAAEFAEACDMYDKLVREP